MSTGPSPMSILHTQDLGDGFFTRLDSIAAELWAHPLDLLAVWFSESGVMADAWNDSPVDLRPELRDNRVGVAQLTPETLRRLGYRGDHGSFRNLGAAEQLDWARAYLLPFRGKLGSIGAIYVATFLPKLVDLAGEESTILAVKAGPLGRAFSANADVDRNDVYGLGVGELEAAVRKNCVGPRWAELVERAGAGEPVTGALPEGIDLGTTLGLERALRRLGYMPGTATGLFGREAQRALVGFQARQELRIDGIFGPRSRAALARELSASGGPASVA